MAEEIINRVANSKLKVIDFEDYYPEGKRYYLILKTGFLKAWYLEKKILELMCPNMIGRNTKTDMLQLLVQQMLLFQIGLTCFISLKLQPYSKLCIIGDLDTLEYILIYQDIITQLRSVDL